MKNNKITIKQFCKELNITKRQFYGLDEYKAGFYSVLRINIDIPDGFSLRTTGTIVIPHYVFIYGNFKPVCHDLDFLGNNYSLIYCKSFKPVVSEINLPNLKTLPKNIGTVDWKRSIHAQSLKSLPKSFKLKDVSDLYSVNFNSIKSIRYNHLKNFIKYSTGCIIMEGLKSLNYSKKLTITVQTLYLHHLNFINNVSLICGEIYFSGQNHKLTYVGKNADLVTVVLDNPPRFIYKTDSSDIYRPLHKTKAEMHITLPEAMIVYKNEKYLYKDEYLYKILSIRELKNDYKILLMTLISTGEDFYCLIKSDNLDTAGICIKSEGLKNLIHKY